VTLSEEYLRQYRWRPWPRIYAALPELSGQLVLDIGCGVGDQAADLAARGARVIGLDVNAELIDLARSRHAASADFICGDVRDFESAAEVDGIWSSFSAAYFSDLAGALRSWQRYLKPGGWIAVTEVDDLFGHEPLAERPKSLLAAYAAEALRLGRYDFYAGHKLQPSLKAAGFRVTAALRCEDLELSFKGPATPEVVEAWRVRFDRMRLLREMCGPEFAAVREQFLECLSNPDHESVAAVYCCIGAKA